MRLPLPKLLASMTVVMYKLKEALLPAAISTGAVAVSLANKATRNQKAAGTALLGLKEALIPSINVISTEVALPAVALTSGAAIVACKTVYRNPKMTAGAN